MGKKKKKKKNNYNMNSVENQMKMADYLFELVDKQEKSKVTIFDGIQKKKKSSVDDLTDQIEKTMKRIAKNNQEYEEEDNSIISNPEEANSELFDEDVIGFDLSFDTTEAESSEEEKEESVYEVVDDPTYLKDSRSEEECEYPISSPESNDEKCEEELDPNEMLLKINIDNRFNRLVIDDGILPTYISIPDIKKTQIDVASAKNIVEDEDDYSDYCANLIYALVLLKHPSAIYTIEEFTNAFKDISEINPTEYKFFYKDNYIFLYIMTEDSMNEIYNLSDYGYIGEEFIKALYTIVLNAGSVHQEFKIDDENIINEVRKFRGNLINIATLLIRSDEGTEFCDNDNDIDSYTLMDRLNVIDVDGFRDNINFILDELEYVDEDNEGEPDVNPSITPLVDVSEMNVPEPEILLDNDESDEESEEYEIEEDSTDTMIQELEDEFDNLTEGLENVVMPENEDTQEVEETTVITKVKKVSSSENVTKATNLDDMVVPVIRKN